MRKGELAVSRGRFREPLRVSEWEMGRSDSWIMTYLRRSSVHASLK